ncbi:MAG: hypothetical protein QM503_15915 [Bacteroidota bacterium]
MEHCNNKPLMVIFVSFLMTLTSFYGCSDRDSLVLEITTIEIPQNNNSQNMEIAVSSPPFSDDIFPCSDCHDSEWETNSQKRILEDMHEEISELFNHDSENRWCLDCHDIYNRDSLKFASGKQLDFKQSYKLCGQCHGDKLRDWKVGVHGKRTGEWNGKKEYLLCVHCHNPHSPKFKPIRPMPPPIRHKNIY